MPSTINKHSPKTDKDGPDHDRYAKYKTKYSPKTDKDTLKQAKTDKGRPRQNEPG